MRNSGGITILPRDLSNLFPLSGRWCAHIKIGHYFEQRIYRSIYLTIEDIKKGKIREDLLLIMLRKSNIKDYISEYGWVIKIPKNEIKNNFTITSYGIARGIVVTKYVKIEPTPLQPVVIYTRNSNPTVEYLTSKGIKRGSLDDILQA